METKTIPSRTPEARAAYRRRPEVKERDRVRMRERRKDPVFRTKEAKVQRTWKDRHPDVLQAQLARRADGTSKVYFIQVASGPIKIGWTKSKKAHIRLQELQVGNHEKLVLLAAVAATEAEEKAMHVRFADAHLRGEWFQPTTELLQLIRELSTTT